MACNYYGFDLLNFIKITAPHVSYIHLADAQGIDGEGVEFGQGDIELVEIWPELKKLMPKAPFIPEVWQGHVNNGTGFWRALNYIEKIDQREH